MRAERRARPGLLLCFPFHLAKHHAERASPSPRASEEARTDGPSGGVEADGRNPGRRSTNEKTKSQRRCDWIARVTMRSRSGGGPGGVNFLSFPHRSYLCLGVTVETLAGARAGATE